MVQKQKKKEREIKGCSSTTVCAEGRKGGREEGGIGFHHGRGEGRRFIIQNISFSAAASEEDLFCISSTFGAAFFGKSRSESGKNTYL